VPYCIAPLGTQIRPFSLPTLASGFQGLLYRRLEKLKLSIVALGAPKAAFAHPFQTLEFYGLSHADSQFYIES
jgi:hypothetical protein